MSELFIDPGMLITRANEILDEAKKRDITLRLIGALAFYIHCPQRNYIQLKAKRYFTDIDFISYIKYKSTVEKMFSDMGYEGDKRIQTIPGIKRSIFYASDHKLHSDVFYDILDFSHQIDFKGRLEIDYPTISLVDLFLEKMQIVQLNEKDVIDTAMLILEHDVGSSDQQMINIDWLSRVCKSNWGLWKTVTNNLSKLIRLLDKYDPIKPEERTLISERIKAILARIEQEPATLRWKLRNRIGERVKWYRDVEEV
jgi:hypothetical protein